MGLREIYTPYANKLYRTSIAVGDASFGQHYSDPSRLKQITRRCRLIPFRWGCCG